MRWKLRKHTKIKSNYGTLPLVDVIEKAIETSLNLQHTL